MTCPKTKQIQEVQITRAVDGSDKLLIVKSGINKSRSVTVDDFIHANSINTGELATDAVETAKIKDANVTLPKIQSIDTAKVLGRTSANEGNVEEVGVVIGASGDAGLLFDNDDLLDNSDTAGGSATRGATQRSVKAYVDAKPILGLQSSTAAAATGKLYVAQTHTFYDLDLSSVVGPNKAMVIMYVEGGSISTGGTQTYIIQAKGGVSGAPASSHKGTGVVNTGSSGQVAGTVVVVTDSSGRLEFAATPASANSLTGANYTVVAFQVIS
jgi:hypothetical protein|tara:strand:- start:60 stop:869 length:810 start_codon:yes stop_codon:yes gene_type:complete